MTYLALYRRWRPKKFEDIVGQEHISKTLQNAIIQKRIAHAYLLCGPRGTGKTSSAKVFAKGVNCLNKSEGEPCNECINCQKITNGSSIDVFEIDAASNRGVDEIRELRERVKFAPTEGAYKIYIIDEVHMLTTEAFNALLKTLEEPPDNIIFILATTEPHKIPLTILSRCQRFDFRPIGMDRILDRLSYICKESNLQAEEEALKVIAKAAEGGMRDALSTLDQCLSLGGNRVAVEDVNLILGTVKEEILYGLINSMLDKDIERSLLLIDQIVREGKDIQHFTKDLVSGFRNLLILSINKKRDDLIIASANILEEVKHLVNKTNKEHIMQIINILTETEKEMKWSNQPRLMLETAIIKATAIKTEENLEALVEKILQLEAKIEKLKEVGIREDTNVKNIVPSKPIIRHSGDKESKVELIKGDDQKLKEIQSLWPKVLDVLKKRDKMQISAFLNDAKPVHFSEQTLVLAFEHSFHKEQIEAPKNKSVVEEILAKGLKQGVALRCLLQSQIKVKQENKIEKKKEDLVNDAQSFFGQNVIIQVQD